MIFRILLLGTLFALLAAFPAAGQQNVVLLSVDTLRADHLGCYGYAQPTSPNIDALAETALLFEDCTCEVPLTNPSMGSMLTSRIPRTTGTTKNGLRMPESVPTVAEAFQAAGYHTFCVQSNWTLKTKISRLHRGFDVYDDGFHKKRWGFVSPERLAEEVNECALRLIESRPQDKPFFAWIHYTDPHAPYDMHRKYNPAGKPVWKMNKTDRVRAKYDSEIAFTDYHIGLLLAALPENTALIFTADHGESLYEHDYLGHGRRIYQDNLHIPLMVRGEGIAPGRTLAPARGVDIAPTLLGLAGLPKTPGMTGLDLLREPPDAARVRVVETYGGAIPRIPGAKAVMGVSKPLHQSAIEQDWKLILSGRKTQLYHLSEDPGELKDLSGKETERTAHLKAVIDAWDTRERKAKQAAADLDSDDVAALDSLGYIE